MKIALLGTGNVAAHLVPAIQSSSAELLGVLGRTPEKTTVFSSLYRCNAFNSIEALSEADLIVACVRDGDLPELLPQLATLAPVVTTSGSFDIHPLGTTPYPIGVFYPLQTFSPGALIHFKDITFFIESKDETLKQQLFAFGNELGKTAIEMSSEQRTHLHLTAVFLNNFTHHVSALGKTYGEAHGMDYSWFAALLDETFRKIKNGASDADQTGPARRNDTNSIQKHLELLDPAQRAVYEALSNSIIQQFHSK